MCIATDFCIEDFYPLCALTCRYVHSLDVSSELSELRYGTQHTSQDLCSTSSESIHFPFTSVSPFLVPNARHAELARKIIEIFVSLPTTHPSSVDTTHTRIHSLENPKLHELHRCKQHSSTPLPQEHAPPSTISAYPDPRHNILGLLANRHTRCSVDPCSAPPGH